MEIYILDTDHVSLILRGNSRIVARAQQFDYSVTIITVQELFNGWIGRINDPYQSQSIANLYSKLWKTTEYLKTVEVLNFTPEAELQYKDLLRDNPLLRKRRIQKDLRIAAIALTMKAMVVTRNYRDFSQIPNLKVIDWNQ